MNSLREGDEDSWKIMSLYVKELIIQEVKSVEKIAEGGQIYCARDVIERYCMKQLKTVDNLKYEVI